MRYLLILNILILSACGPAHVDMPDEMIGYYNDYFSIVPVSKKNSGTIILDDKLDMGLRGRCDQPLIGNWTIRINKLTWQRMDWYNNSDDQKRSLLFHELTHCTFDSMGHSPDPHSYMYAGYAFDQTKDELYSQTAEYTSHL